MSRDLQTIMAEWLKQNGYDGLYSPFNCACEVSDLMPCGEPSPQCRPGYKGPCKPETCVMGGDCDFHIYKEPQS